MSAVVAIVEFGLGALIGAAVGAAVRDYYATAVAVSRMPHLGGRVSFIEGKVRHFGTFVGRDGAARRVLLDDGTGHTVSVYDQVIPVNPRPWKSPPPPPPMTYRENAPSSPNAGGGDS